MTELEQGILKMSAFRKAGGKIYFFDMFGTVCSMPVEKVNEGTCEYIKGLHLNSSKGPYISSYHLSRICTKKSILQMVFARLCEGDTLDDFERLLKTCKPAPKGSKKPTGLDAFICKIDSPIFYRSPDNLNENTFDYIYIDVSIRSDSIMENRDEYLNAHIKEIAERVAEKLENSKDFQKYGVPINFLRVCRTTIKRKSSVLQFVFELKLQE